MQPNTTHKVYIQWSVELMVFYTTCQRVHWTWHFGR
jgi:hypothetical protein